MNRFTIGGPIAADPARTFDITQRSDETEHDWPVRLAHSPETEHVERRVPDTYLDGPHTLVELDEFELDARWTLPGLSLEEAFHQMMDRDGRAYGFERRGQTMYLLENTRMATKPVECSSNPDDDAACREILLQAVQHPWGSFAMECDDPRKPERKPPVGFV